MPAIKKSKQRDAICRELSSRTDHPTADELYQALKKDFPNLSLATVYRNLKMLSEDGKILCIPGESSDHFDATVAQHYHLSCTRCHRIYDLDMPEIPEIDSAAKKYFKGKVDTYSLIYVGLCEHCSNL